MLRHRWVLFKLLINVFATIVLLAHAIAALLLLPVAVTLSVSSREE